MGVVVTIGGGSTMAENRLRRSARGKPSQAESASVERYMPLTSDNAKIGHTSFRLRCWARRSKLTRCVKIRVFFLVKSRFWLESPALFYTPSSRFVLLVLSEAVHRVIHIGERIGGRLRPVGSLAGVGQRAVLRVLPGVQCFGLEKGL